MTAFRPGDLAIVTGDSADWDHAYEAGAVVEIKAAYSDDSTGHRGYRCRAHGGLERYVATADLRPHTPIPSPLDRLITALLESRVSIEQRWHDTDRTTYRIVIEEKA